MKFHTKKFLTIIIINVLALIMTSAVYAQDAASVKDGTYIGVFVTQNQMSGDFDDSKDPLYSTSNLDRLDIPDVDSGAGLGILLGVRMPNAKGAVEIGYQRSRHDVSGVFYDYYGGGGASYNVIDLNIKIDVLARDQIRPYILFGFGIPWLTIEDDIYNWPYGPMDTEDATFTGLCLNVGAGAAYYFRPDLAVTGGIIYRWNRFSSAEGGKLEDALVEKALCFRVGVNYTF